MTTHIYESRSTGTLSAVDFEAFQQAASAIIPPESRVLVGYSGGPDSTCLLHLMHRAGFDIVAGHLHHSQRAEADEELLLAEQFCENLGTPFVSGRADVPRMAADLKIGLEEAGRHARYQFFASAAAQTGCQMIATAHTRDDHSETVLFNLARGSGLAGLAGIPARRENIVRPLLSFARAETVAYCAEHALWTHVDPANSDVSFSRARMRHRIMPELRAINPEVDQAIARLSAVVSEEDAFLDQAALKWLELVEWPLNEGLHFLTSSDEFRLRRESYIAGPPVLRRRALRWLASFLGASPEFAHMDRIEKGVGDSTSGSETLPGGGVVVEWDEESIQVRSLLETEPYRHALTVPGETFADSFGWKITAFTSPGKEIQKNESNLAVGLDLASIKGELYFRSVAKAERFQPLGMSQAKLVSDMLQERRLSKLARRRLPIVCDFVGPIWIPGVAIADRVKVTEATERQLMLSFGPISS